MRHVQQELVETEREDEAHLLEADVEARDHLRRQRFDCQHRNFPPAPSVLM
jgi:hypothetical protein